MILAVLSYVITTNIVLLLVLVHVNVCSAVLLSFLRSYRLDSLLVISAVYCTVDSQLVIVLYPILCTALHNENNIATFVPAMSKVSLILLLEFPPPRGLSNGESVAAALI